MFKSHNSSGAVLDCFNSRNSTRGNTLLFTYRTIFPPQHQTQWSDTRAHCRMAKRNSVPRLHNPKIDIHFKSPFRFSTGGAFYFSAGVSSVCFCILWRQIGNQEAL